MTDIERYVRAATRDNTRRSYQAAIEHFEAHWGGFLPATADSIARYLADHAEQHAVSTLRQRLAALSQWHISQGFPDPTKAPLVRQVLRGIRTLHPTPPKQAAPLLLQHLQRAAECFEEEARQAREHHDLRALRRARRDAALLLLFQSVTARVYPACRGCPHPRTRAMMRAFAPIKQPLPRWVARQGLTWITAAASGSFRGFQFPCTWLSRPFWSS